MKSKLNKKGICRWRIWDGYFFYLNCLLVTRQNDNDQMTWQCSKHIPVTFKNNTFLCFKQSYKIFLFISTQSLNLGGRRGITDDAATIPFHPSLSSAALRESPTPIPVHSLMLIFLLVIVKYHTAQRSIMEKLTIINAKQSLRYTDHRSHSCRADKNPYRHDGRADKDTYRHDGRTYSLSQWEVCSLVAWVVSYHNMEEVKNLCRKYNLYCFTVKNAILVTKG